MPRITKKIIIVSVSSTALGRQFPFHPRLWVLYLNPTLSVTARVFLAYPEDLTIQRTTVSVCQHSSGHVIPNTVP
jgi:hypothetical protein